MGSGLGVVLVIAVDMVLRSLRGYFIDLASARIDMDLSAKIMERVLGVRMEARPAAVGAFSSNLRSFESVRDFITSASVTAFIDLPFALLFVLVIGVIAWQLIIPVFLPLSWSWSMPTCCNTKCTRYRNRPIVRRRFATPP